ncbi:M23 family metallopeptidase [Salinicoccus luteus]|uniref:M23 family metallopeptidase n=1 Tax=Salinicoccus luteus TaxID=367840 RepID=UPI0004E0E2A8|nr:M23 family metallopeptidase [Salinicoccus luteus]
MNPIDYLVGQGFRVTSDPTRYRSGIWGKRDYTVDGYNYDTYCGGYHRAYDLAKAHLAPVPAVCSGEVAPGTARHGNFGGTVVIANKALGIQVIYGHLDRNLKVRVGQTVRQGDTVGLQSNTNYDNVQMASHLHIQFQKYGYIAGERAFVCTGINPLKINVSEAVHLDTWLWHGHFTADSRIRLRDHPSKQAAARGIITPGTKVRFDRLYVNEGLWWIRITTGGKQRCIAVGEKQTGVTFRRANTLGRLWGKAGGLDTSRGKEKQG